MFIQVISGQVADPVDFETQWRRWETEVRPGAIGFLGATAGISADGRFVALARFESADAARANSERPEQGAWWTETEKQFAGEVSFTDTDDAYSFMGGGSDDAGFVQIIESADADRAALEEFDALFEKHASGWRPEVIGGVRAWTGLTSYVEAVYFTSEAAARAGEGSEPPTELAARMDEFREHMASASFTDISSPWLS